jgi:hypothetical protein
VIYVGVAPSGRFQIHRVPADGTGQLTLHSPAEGLAPASATSHGIVFANRLGAQGIDLVTVAPDGSVREWLASPFQEVNPRVSPDDEWVAYQSNRTGRSEIYLRAASGKGPDRQVTPAGGVQPDWSADGGSLFFVRDRRVYRVDVTATTLGIPVPVHADSRLIFARPSGDGLVTLHALDEERPLTTLNLVTNWTGEVRRRAAGYK